MYLQNLRNTKMPTLCGTGKLEWLKQTQLQETNDRSSQKTHFQKNTL